ncbi:MAG: tRNA (adenosine(37)-N6)-threonylcarbamoyltransferase complex ATPase subunit type 1 TsaE [Bacilli bacterium]|nr:tRNA (adenosine(37)-N6)-threonylcarbamoyltransferase complex ATPase subunit type 1 TsaE [Bacilli bacterium]
MKQIELLTSSEAETKQFGRKLAKNLPNGSVIALVGDLGAGKTTLVRGVAEALNIKEVVQSPTFNIMKIYLKGDKPLIHIDAYRLADIDTDIGLDEYIGYETGLTMIEWPMYIERLIPKDAIYVEIKHSGGDNRLITVNCNNEKILEALE